MDRNVSVYLLWVPEGQKPSEEQFGTDQSDPLSGPEPWCIFEMAAAYAMHTVRTDDYVPWIKVGGTIIGPEKLRELHKADTDRVTN